MRRLPFAILAAMLCAFMVGCSLDEDKDESQEDKHWAENNEAWYAAQQELKDADGKPFYTKVVPSWNTSSSVLMHWFNDRSLTAGNYVPMETSMVDVKYILRLYNGTPVDSSYRLKVNGDSIFRTLVTDVIPGWQIALQNMHVGDSVRVAVPFAEGYGSKGSGNIKPYSALEFDIKLVNIPYYEVRP